MELLLKQKKLMGSVLNILFFSSRRRHTRSLCDWSSDVCSSDLSPRMHNAAFAVRGLDWTYVALDVEPERLEDAVRGLDALGFAGANVTAPHKQGVARILGSALPSVNTILRGGRTASTDTAILEQVASCHKPVVIGDGGAAN